MKSSEGRAINTLATSFPYPKGEKRSDSSPKRGVFLQAIVGTNSNGAAMPLPPAAAAFITFKLEGPLQR